MKDLKSDVISGCKELYFSTLPQNDKSTETKNTGNSASLLNMEKNAIQITSLQIIMGKIISFVYVALQFTFIEDTINLKGGSN